MNKTTVKVVLLTAVGVIVASWAISNVDFLGKLVAKKAATL